MLLLTFNTAVERRRRAQAMIRLRPLGEAKTCLHVRVGPDVEEIWTTFLHTFVNVANEFIVFGQTALLLIFRS